MNTFYLLHLLTKHLDLTNSEVSRAYMMRLMTLDYKLHNLEQRKVRAAGVQGYV